MAGQKADTMKNAAAESNEVSVTNPTDPRKAMTTIAKSDSPPMAVLPLNSSAKLDQEPNPFEQSFSVATSTKDERKIDPGNKPTLPPINNPSTKDTITWNSLRTTPLSPSMLQGPANSEEFNSYVNKTTSGHLGVPVNTGAPMQVGMTDTTFADGSRTTAAYAMPNQSTSTVFTGRRSDSVSSATSDMSIMTPADRGASLGAQSISSEKSQEYGQSKEQSSKRSTEDRGTVRKSRRKMAAKDNDITKKKSMKSQGLTVEEEEKRKNFLERNRLAALKCRQRKKQWLSNLQTKVEYLTNDNEQLQLQTNALRDEVVNLRTLLLSHKDCQITQGGYNIGQVLKSMPQSMPQSIQRQQLQATAGPPMSSMNPASSIYTHNARSSFSATTGAASSHSSLMNSAKISAMATATPNVRLQQPLPPTNMLLAQHQPQHMVQQQHPGTTTCSSSVLRF
ncbi:hypothetical protein DFQ28_002534 [Apophysomyces sp. BC1034]|nr:hypothetical protein DFQ30_004581 [Apophysomyces sp. BC1015]KAG0178250.1 hypothetical protein DFQ29_003715 [Apophysomyces sp. BC1021]KAG0190060.1 hypothetical protein DFQ28_002534 [Apophysomyces sp. BC1034]